MNSCLSDNRSYDCWLQAAPVAAWLPGLKKRTLYGAFHLFPQTCVERYALYYYRGRFLRWAYLAILRDDLLIPIGGLCLAAAILMDRFIGPGALVDFLVGVFTGLAIVLNLLGLYRSRKQT